MSALRGSCLCGGVRFEIDGTLMRSSHCYCRQCQKAHGAPFRTRARVRAADFRFLVGEELVSFCESTPGTHRGFCKVCGAPVLVKFDEHSRSARTDLGAAALYGVALSTRRRGSRSPTICPNTGAYPWPERSARFRPLTRDIGSRRHAGRAGGLVRDLRREAGERARCVEQDGVNQSATT
jgi:hypothetical protein